MTKYLLMMVIGCGLVLLLSFLLPGLCSGSGWALAVTLGAILLCHLMRFAMHNA